MFNNILYFGRGEPNIIKMKWGDVLKRDEALLLHYLEYQWKFHAAFMDAFINFVFLYLFNRNCIGQNFAMSEEKVVLATLLKK
jgi:hypothetical protein